MLLVYFAVRKGKTMSLLNCPGVLDSSDEQLLTSGGVVDGRGERGGRLMDAPNRPSLPILHQCRHPRGW